MESDRKYSIITSNSKLLGNVLPQPLGQPLPAKVFDQARPVRVA